MDVIFQMRGDLLELVLPEHYTKEEFFAAYTEAIRVLSLKSPTPVLINAQRVEVERSAKQILDTAHWHGQLLEFVGPNFAVLVSSDLYYGLARMFRAFAESEGCAVEVFRDEEKALAWLADPESKE